MSIALVGERLDVPLDPALVGVALRQRQQAEDALLAPAALPGELGRAPRELAGHVGHHVRLDLRLARQDAEGRGLVVADARALHAHDAPGMQLLGPRRGEERAAPHRERLVLGRPDRVGPRRHGVEHRARCLDELDLDGATVGLVVLLEHLGQPQVGLADLVDGVVDAERLADEAVDRVGVAGQPGHDGDGVAGDAGRGGAVVVVAADHALGTEEERDRDLAGLGIAGVGPLDVEALLLGHAPRRDAVGQLALGRGRRGPAGRAGGLWVVVPEERHADQGGHEGHHRADGAVPARQVPVGVSVGQVAPVVVARGGCRLSDRSSLAHGACPAGMVGPDRLAARSSTPM